jgi:hypothetical protein
MEAERLFLFFASLSITEVKISSYKAWILNKRMYNL